MTIATINPANGETIETFEALAPAGIERCLSRAAHAFGDYRRTSFAERAGWLQAAASRLEAASDDVAATVSLEMGKTLSAAQAEVAKCVSALRAVAGEAPSHLADEEADAGTTGGARAYVRYLPLGAVLAVMPWNFPLWQVTRFAGPALMAGNVVLLKHASNVPRTACYLEALFAAAGFPTGVFQTLLIPGSAVADVIADERVRAVTVTGSAGTGRAVAEAAGRALKPSVLELGGSDPFIVLPSADVAEAAKVAATARCQNNGQSCIAAKRFIVHRDVAAGFEEHFVAAMAALVVGDPSQPTTDVGPLVSRSARDDLEALVADATARGARLLCGGRRLDGPGWFYPPTVVGGLTPAMRLYHEEAFGPVAQLYEVGSLDEAITLANATRFGLGSSLWSNDPDEIERAVDDLEAGSVFINAMVASHPALPFGGVKESGYGRELSAHGTRAFCNVKTVWVAPHGDSRRQAAQWAPAATSATSATALSE